MTERAPGRDPRPRVPDTRASSVYDPGCNRCPRLVEFLATCHKEHPDYWARPVPSFGAAAPSLVIVGLAPGMNGANRTGRPFTGDHAGILLYQTLHELGLGSLPASTAADDALRLTNVRILNAVKCVPPQNKPLPVEIRSCNAWLKTELEALASVRVILALGRVAHDAVLKALGRKAREALFAHGAEHRMDETRLLVDSYHCSRYNTQTGVLTTAMFRKVVSRARELAGA